MDVLESAPQPTFAAQALAALVPMLRRYLFVLGAAADRIDDLVQEVLVVAVQKSIADRGTAAAGQWLRGVARNLLLRERRSAAARREVELAHEVWCEDGGDTDGDDRLDALRACVDALPARSRALLHGAYRDDRRRGELARSLGMRPDGIKTALRRVRAALRACIERKRGGGRTS